MTRLLPILLAATLVVAACGTDSDDLPALSEMTETYGCGHGFWIGNPSETAALRFAYLGDDGDATDARLPDPRWQVELLVGTDLYANWCDDVIEPGEPEPDISATSRVVEGSLEIIGDSPTEPFTPATLTLEARGLAVEMDDAEIVPLGDVTIVNTSYGVFAG